MEDKEIDLGEGCKITVKRHETGSRDFCLNCDGEEQMTFSYSGKGTKINAAEKTFESVMKKVENKAVEHFDNMIDEE